MKNNKIKGFDGIRGIAVLFVLLSHFSFHKFIHENVGLSYIYLNLFDGGTGVNIFFVLSGFLITLLLLREYEKNDRISLKNFYIRRALRIYPIYVLFLFIATLLYFMTENFISIKALIYSTFYIYNFLPLVSHSNILSHTWSLSVEEQFYLIWPLFFTLMIKKHHIMLLIGVLLFAFSSLLWHVLLYRAHMDYYYNVDRFTFISGYTIAFGCAAAMLIRNKLFQRCIRVVGLVLGILLYFSPAFLLKAPVTLQYFIQTIGIVFLVSWIYLHQSGRIVSLLENPILCYLGKISYGIYLYQGLFISHHEPYGFWPPSKTITFICLIILCPLSFRYIETYFLRLKSKYSV